MFAKLAIFVASVAVFAAASPLPGHAESTPAIHNSCNTGSLQCCNSVQSADSEGVSKLLSLLQVAVDATTQVGVTCSPITALGVAGNSCSSQSVCCSNNSFNGVVAIGCTPVNINL